MKVSIKVVQKAQQLANGIAAKARQQRHDRINANTERKKALERGVRAAIAAIEAAAEQEEASISADSLKNIEELGDIGRHTI